MTKNWHNIAKDLSILTLVIGLLFGVLLGQYPLETPDSARYAEIPREMLVTHDYVTPHLNGIKYFEKPPLFYWMQAVAIKHLGVNELGVSVVNALMALMCCLLVYIIGRKVYDRTSGIIAALILASSSLFFALTRIITLDMTFTTFLTACLGCFLVAKHEPHHLKRLPYVLLSYAFAGCAFMTKGLIGWLFPGMIVLVWATIFEEWQNTKHYQIAIGVLIVLAISLPWHIWVQIRNPEFFHFYFIEQHLLRYFTPYAGRQESWWFLPTVLILGICPWTFFILQTLKHHLIALYQRHQHYRDTAFFFLWIGTVYVFYSFSQSQLIPYLLPALPPLALLIGRYLVLHFNQRRRWLINFSFIVFFIVSLTGATIVYIYADANHYLSFAHALIILAAFLGLSGIMTNFVYWQYGLRHGVYALFITFSCLLISLNPIITIANNHSVKPLIDVLNQTLTPNDEVVSYSNYYQDLPFYLQRRITIVNSFGELSFGVEHQDAEDWMIDTETLLKRWQDTKRMYMIADVEDFENLVKNENIVFYPIKRYTDKVLVTNHELP